MWQSLSLLSYPSLVAQWLEWFRLNMTVHCTKKSHWKGCGWLARKTSNTLAWLVRFLPLPQTGQSSSILFGEKPPWVKFASDRTSWDASLQQNGGAGIGDREFYFYFSPLAWSWTWRSHILMSGDIQVKVISQRFSDKSLTMVDSKLVSVKYWNTAMSLFLGRRWSSSLTRIRRILPPYSTFTELDPVECRLLHPKLKSDVVF